uniref:Putative cytochrome c, monohaem n=1 Tax=Magnetococcus massalia (strain MO-1) TaxID=451514 RepID=A0A1S7LDW8_MAGMO|nr:Putative cytochrome c, monohaem [Candidatus Magnetococcus massalia]
MKNRKALVGVATALAMVLCGSAFAGWNEKGGEKDAAVKLKPNLENGKVIYEVCSACHMPEGWGLDDGTFPQIAGQHREVLIKQLADIRAENRDVPTMYPFAIPSEIGGAQSIADVAAYISKLPMNNKNGVGKGDNLERGQAIYEKDCVRCHGDMGEGSAGDYFPAVYGQHYRYVLRQMEWIRDGKRRNANPDMVRQLRRFSQADLEAVSDYVSRLKPPADRIAKSGWRNVDFD